MSSIRKPSGRVIRGTAIAWGAGELHIEFQRVRAAGAKADLIPKIEEGSRVKFTQNAVSFEGVITFIHEGIICSVAVLGHANTFIVPIRTLTLL